MDGIELVPDHRTAPLRGEEAAAQPAKSRRRRFAALPVAGVILGIVLIPAYYVSTRRAAPQDADRPPIKVSADSPAPDRPPVVGVKATDGAAPPVSPEPSPSPAPGQEEKRSKRRGEKKPEGANGKKESKLDSIFKKTGRALKKPFKL